MSEKLDCNRSSALFAYGHLCLSLPLHPWPSSLVLGQKFPPKLQCSRACEHRELAGRSRERSSGWPCSGSAVVPSAQHCCGLRAAPRAGGHRTGKAPDTARAASDSGIAAAPLEDKQLKAQFACARAPAHTEHLNCLVLVVSKADSSGRRSTPFCCQYHTPCSGTRLPPHQHHTGKAVYCRVGEDWNATAVTILWHDVIFCLLKFATLGCKKTKNQKNPFFLFPQNNTS